MSKPPGHWARWRSSALVGLLVVTAWTACFRFPAVWSWTGIGEAGKPFLDLYGLLAAGERAQAGFDASLANPLDPYRRPNIYPAWWLKTGEWGLTRADTAWLGVALTATFLVTALVLLRPRSRGEVVATLALMLSPPFLMAVQRANNDTLVFLVVSVALLAFRSDLPVARVVAVAIVALSVAMKYYSLSAAVLLLYARSRRELVAWGILFAGILCSIAPALAGAGWFKPRPEWLYAFGAPVVWRNIHLENQVLWLVPAIALFCWSAWKGWRDYCDAPEPHNDAVTEEAEFFIGASFIIGCFFLGASYVYKLIFAVWLLPWLWRGPFRPSSAAQQKLIAGALFAVLWLEGVGALVVNLVIIPLLPGAAMRLLLVVLTIHQILSWGLVACLLRWSLAVALRRTRGVFQAQGLSQRTAR